MDASRLLAVTTEIEAEFKDGLTALLKELIQQYTVARDTPSQDNTASIQKALSALTEYVDNGVFSQYPPSRLAVLEAIGGTDRVGPGFRKRLAEILSIAGQTTAGIVAGLTQLQTDLQAFRKACEQTRTGLDALRVVAHTISPGQFEVGVLIPERLVDQKLGLLAKELEAWNLTLRGFQEVAGEEEREIVLGSLASGSYEAYIPLGFIAAGMVSKTIDKVLEWYLKVLEIRKRREELKSLGAPVAEASAIKKHERDILEQGIRALAEELVKDTHSKVDAARRRELENHLTISIRQVARFVDRGGTVEVDSTPPSEPEEPTAPEAAAEAAANEEYERAQKEFAKVAAHNARVSAILSAGASLKLLPERSEPILQLTDGEAAEEPLDPEKATKKRGQSTT